MHFLYHDLELAAGSRRSGFQSPSAKKYKLSEKVFKSHIIKFRSLLDERDLEENFPESLAIKFSFDDGGVSALRVSEILEYYGFRGHFFIVTSLLGKDGFLSAADIRDLSDRGHSIGSHSHTHPDRMAFLSSHDLIAEWQTSKGTLEDILGLSVRTCSIPGGSFRKPTLKVISDVGYSETYTSEPTMKVSGRLVTQAGMRMQIFGRIPVSALWTEAYLEGVLTKPSKYIAMSQARYFLKRVLVDTNPLASKIYNATRRRSGDLY